MLQWPSTEHEFPHAVAACLLGSRTAAMRAEPRARVKSEALGDSAFRVTADENTRIPRTAASLLWRSGSCATRGFQPRGLKRNETNG
jgi:hypothetical protein